MMSLLPKIAHTWADKQRYTMGGYLWGALFPAVAWGHHGLSDDSASAGSQWFVFLLPLLVFGVVFAVVWLVSILLERRQKPRV